MAYQKYRFSMKSEELRGAGQPNIAYVMLNSDADAILFAQNLEVAYQADVVTVDLERATNYTLPYPAGSNSLTRLVLRDDFGHVDTEYIYDFKAGADAAALASALIGAGVLLPGFGFHPATSVQVTVFTPGESV